MEIEKLRNAVYEKTGIKLDEADPLFALVALNEAIIEELWANHQFNMQNHLQILDSKINTLESLYNRAIESTLQLEKNANHAHLKAALSAASEARTEIMNAARSAISEEVKKSATIVTDATERLRHEAGLRVNPSIKVLQWILQATISGLIAGAMVIIFRLA